MKHLSEQSELPVVGTVADTQSAERAARLITSPRYDAHVTLYWSRYFAGVGQLTPAMITAWNGGAK
jgi:hypothetical protein